MKLRPHLQKYTFNIPHGCVFWIQADEKTNKQRNALALIQSPVRRAQEGGPLCSSQPRQLGDGVLLKDTEPGIGAWGPFGMLHMSSR